MPVPPGRLDGIRAHRYEVAQLKGGGAERSLGVLIEVAHDVHFSSTTGAGTMTTQLLEAHETFTTILPFDRQFLADGLNIKRSHPVT